MSSSRRSKSSRGATTFPKGRPTTSESVGGAALAGRFRRLVHYSCLGVLDEPAERRFQSLCDDLRSVSELIERFDLARPRFTDTPSHPTLR